MKGVITYIIRRYQKAGGGKGLLNCECNFTPSCSEYAVQSIDQFGMMRGTVYAFRRLRRCNGRDQPVVIRDPVPEMDAKVSQVSA